MICHTVTKSHSAPWRCHKNGGVRYYDVSLAAIGDGNIDSLFAVKDAYSPQQEILMNVRVEQPLARLKRRLVGGRATQIIDIRTQITSWPEYRALHLYIMMQASRLKSTYYKDDAATGDLEWLLNSTEAELDQLAHAAESRFAIYRVDLPQGFPLFFPDTGYFAFPEEPDGALPGRYGFAVPVTPYVAWLYVSPEADRNRVWEWRHSLSAYSLGLGDSIGRILIPPILVRSTPGDEICARVAEIRSALADLERSRTRLRELLQ